MGKLLTAAVPAYNAGWCLDKCLSSFVTDPVSSSIEVIVVNDGSTDGTREIALGYAGRHPGIFRLIDKENGGHGSVINAAVKQAAGKYFNVVDADDWILTDNLPRFLETLSRTEADVLLTHYHTVDANSGKRREFKTGGIPLNEAYTLDEFTAHRGNIYPCVNLHGLTYRTGLYRNSGTILSEGIFYEDQEYATLPFVNVQTILPLDLFLNQYRIGSASQSVSDRSIVKRLSHVEQVVRRLFRCYIESGGASEGAKRYIAWKAADMLHYYYVAALVKNPDKPGGRKEAARVREEMRGLAPSIVEKMDFRYRLSAAMNRLKFSGRAVEFMKRPFLYDMYWKLFRQNRG